MADRKGKTVTVKFPCTATVTQVKNALAKENKEANVNVIQDPGAGEFLIEFKMKEEAEDFIDSGVDYHDIHLNCNPPHGYYVNVSILGLRAYVNDDKVIEVLSKFGEIKSDVIRLKYKADHKLAGIENGNQLVRMVLTKVSIPYSLRIDGQWCQLFIVGPVSFLNENNVIFVSYEKVECRLSAIIRLQSLRVYAN